jgi:hypothetical protein
MKINSGKWWILGLLALGSTAGLIAVTYWQSPQNSVRWSFTQIHTSIVRNKRDNVARFLRPRVTLDGRTMSAEDFQATYALPAQPDVIEAAPCAATPGHWTVAMHGRIYCFIGEGRLWKLHWVGNLPCACRPEAEPASTH